MTFQEAVALVKTEFETRKEAPHCEIIRTGLTFDGCNGFCVCIYNTGEEVILTDMGETKEIFDEITEEEWTLLCEEHGFEFVHWRIVGKLETIEDVHAYIEFLNYIADTFCPMD